MVDRIQKAPESSFFLFGPRGSGKTTWIRSLFPNAHWIDLLDEGLFQRYLADPSLPGLELAALNKGSRVCIDEIQRLPSLLNEVHRYIEKLGLRFILTGSSARKLRRAGVNLLAGRAQVCQMFPFVPEELGGHFSLDDTLRYGSLPIVWASTDREATLAAYALTYLKEEIQAEALVRNLPGFARFLPIAALFHGQRLNIASLARDAGTARTTIHDYVTILEDTMLAYRLQAFEARLRVRERAHPKLYWIDPGIVRAIKKERGSVTHEEKGVLLEGYVAMLLRYYGHQKNLYDDLYYWAPSGGQLEVDFLLKRGKEFVALEVKSSNRLRPEDLRGLQAIEPLKGLKKRILIYRGNQQLKVENIEVLPFATFLDHLAAGQI
ncbi:MAG: ATP-binding protein [Spirochaetales bacterium]|nr:ATP-binding protein [Spirochaetales bacterium]